MQTKQQIQQLLASAGASPNKRLGQHFLIDLNLMRLLIDSAHINNSDIVLEVGCGTGSLTEALADCAGAVIAVERDKALAKIAKAQLAGSKNVRIINSDILETKSTISRAVTKAIQLAPKGRGREKYRGRLLLVGNLPYSVASPVILNLSAKRTADLLAPLEPLEPRKKDALTGAQKGSNGADGMYVTVQKEVAQRITARPGEKHYGTLSIFMGATGDVKTIRVLKPTVFWPQPKVDSAMISFVRKKKKASRIHNFELFSNVVSLFLQHRRKMLKTCTKFFPAAPTLGPRTRVGRRGLAQIDDWPEIFKQCSIDPTRRPDQLSPEDYIAIANLSAKRTADLCHRYSCSEQLNRK